MADEKLDILLGIMLEGNKEAAKGLEDMTKEVQDLEKAEKAFTATSEASIKAQAELLKMSEDFVRANQGSLKTLASLGGVTVQALEDAAKAAQTIPTSLPKTAEAAAEQSARIERLTKNAMRNWEALAQKTETTNERITKTAITTPKDIEAGWEDFDQFMTDFYDRFEQTGKKIQDLQTGKTAGGYDIDKFWKNWKKTREEVEQLDPALVALDKEINAVAAATGLTVEQVEILPDAIYESAAAAVQLKARAEQVTKESAKLRATFNEIAATSTQIAGAFAGLLGVGVATVGGIFAAASRYASNVEKATATSKAWSAEMDLIRRNGERIGAVLAKEALPLLIRAARVTSRIASFIEEHPELIKAAIGFGTAAAVIGAIGTVTFRAITAFARAGAAIATAQNIAGKIMDKAADKQLAAAGAMNKASVTSATGGALKGLAATTIGGVSLGTIGTVGAGVAAIGALNIGATKVLDFLYEQFEKMGDVGKTLTATFKLLENSMAAIPGLQLVPYIRQMQKGFEELRPILERLGIVAKEVGDNAEHASKGVAGTTSFGGGLNKDVIDAYIQFRDQATQIEEGFQRDRLRIIQDYSSNLRKAVADNEKRISAIGTSYRRTVEKILEDGRRAEVKAERDYARQRQQIIRDSGEDIKRIEEDLQEELRKLSLDHEERIGELVAQRDALGIVRENRRYARDQEEAERRANIEMARRRQDLAQRLRDLREDFLYERQQRREQLAERLKDAQEQYELELKQQREAHEERLKQLRDARTEQLRELDAQHREELLRNREAFIARIRDLDASLLNETQLRRSYYAQMIQDAQAFFANYRSALSGGQTGISGSTGRTPTRQQGGYVPQGGGMVLTHPDEYVMNAGTTRMLENVLGGRVSEEGLRALARGRTGNQSIVNLEFPGGLVTIPILGDILDDRDSKLVRRITEAFS